MSGKNRPPITSTENVDLIVIGAGINGLGIARDAAERGLSVALIEQEDICHGVSAWSGRLIHGGLRYLEHYDFGLVRESLRERERLFKVAPHLVRPVSLIMPFYAKNTRPSWLIRLGMLAYDVLSFDKSVPWHKVFSAAKIRERFTGMEENGLSGAAVFIDGQVEYAERLLVELAVAAADAGADIRLHERVTGVITEGTTVVGVTTDMNGEHSEVRAQLVINAAGPWVDRVTGQHNNMSSSPRLIGGSKGSHIIVDPFPGAPADVVYYESQSDGRLVLVIPWMGRYLIGCTDILFDEDPDAARAEKEEIAYLLNETNTLIPGANLTVDDVLYTYSGVRPLPYVPGVKEWKIPRSHIVHDHESEGFTNFLSIVGGKLTTYRQLAEDATDIAMKRLTGKKGAPVSKDLHFPGAPSNPSALRADLLQTSGLEGDVVDRLIDIYGQRATKVAHLAAENAELRERFDPKSPAIAAELVFGLQDEFAQTLTDLFARRLLLAFHPDHGLDALERAADIVAPYFSWSAADKKRNIEQYREWLDHLRVPQSVSP
jgi:glycerol-3-phosphate dehydrogenase